MLYEVITSTNAVLHLLAMANAMHVKLTIDDFTRIGKKVPVLADLKPSGRYMMSDFCKIVITSYSIHYTKLYDGVGSALFLF